MDTNIGRTLIDNDARMNGGCRRGKVTAEDATHYTVHWVKSGSTTRIKRSSVSEWGKRTGYTWTDEQPVEREPLTDITGCDV